MKPTTHTASKKLLAYKILKPTPLPNGKALYGLHFAFSLDTPASELASSLPVDNKALIDGIWQQILDLSTDAVVQAIQVKEVKKLPLDHEDELELDLSWHTDKDYFDSMTPYVGKPNKRVYTVLMCLVADKDKMGKKGENAMYRLGN